MKLNYTLFIFKFWISKSIESTIKSGNDTIIKPVIFSSDDEEPENMIIQINHNPEMKEVALSCKSANTKANYLESNTSDEDDRDVWYIVEEKEFLSYKLFLIKHSQYFREIVDSINTVKKNYRILLPKWVDQESFAIFLKILETENMDCIDINRCQKLLWIADFLKWTCL